MSQKARMILMALLIGATALLFYLYPTEPKRVESPPQPVAASAELPKPISVPEPTPPAPWTNSIGMEFVWIPPGQIPRLDEEGKIIPGQFIVVEKGFYMGKFEVSTKLWNQLVTDNQRNLPDNVPVPISNLISVEEFLKRLKEMKKTQGEYRIPTKDQWEYACRAGSNTMYYPGIKNVLELGEFAWIIQDQPVLRDVMIEGYFEIGQKKPNPFGLHDMIGNALEIVLLQGQGIDDSEKLGVEMFPNSCIGYNTIRPHYEWPDKSFRLIYNIKAY